MKVLVVDDTEEARMILSEILLQDGFEVREAKNGVEALNLLNKEIPDIIISDIMMPVMDGFMFLKNLNEKSTIKKIPFIFYTSNYVSKEDMDFGLSLGASRFLIKPISPLDILTNIRSVINEFETGKSGHGKPVFIGEKYLENYNKRLFMKLESKIIELEEEIKMRKEAQEEMRRTKQMLENIAQGIDDGILLLSKDYRVLWANRASLEETGCAKEDITGKHCYEVTHHMDKPCQHPIDCPIPNTQKTGKPTTASHIHVDKEGNKMFIDISVYPLLDEKGDIYQYIYMTRNVTQSKQAEEALKESEESHRRLVESCPFGITIHSDRKLIYLNSEAAKILGASSTEQLIGKSVFDIIHPDYYGIANDRIQMQDEGKIAPMIEEKLLRIDGTPVDVELVAIPFMYKNKRSMYGVFQDITKRKQSEENINQSIKEKEILLREVHHRVKNNMQIISSLLQLQSDYIEEKKYKDIFKESQNRILTMSLVHEKLYQSSDFARIDIENYVQDMVNMMFQSYGVSADKIKSNLDIEDVSLGVDLAIPCGLIINELVSNGIKHAFPDDGKGEIGIRIRKTDKNDIELVIRDNGVGIPEYVDLSKSDSMGLYLVRMLAEDQLDGEINLSRSNGTEFRIKFKGGK